MVEKSNWAKLKLSAALRWQVDDPADDALEIVGEGCRVSHDAMLRFQQRVHLLIASILIVPATSCGCSTSSRDRIFPAGSFM